MIDEIIWEVPIQTVGKLLELCQTVNTGKKQASRREKEYTKRKLEKLEEWHKNMN